MKNWQDDHYTKKARQQKYLARSVFKLQEICQKEDVFKNAKLVLDLGASPGSWTQWALKAAPKAKIIAVDIKSMQLSDPRLEFHHRDLNELTANELLGQEKADVVLSDMAPKTTGIAQVDVIASLGLAELAMDWAKQCLKDDGYFVVKVFMGEGFEEFQKVFKQTFVKVKRLRPESTRKGSKEIFFIGKSLKRK